MDRDTKLALVAATAAALIDILEAAWEYLPRFIGSLAGGGATHAFTTKEKLLVGLRDLTRPEKLRTSDLFATIQLVHGLRYIGVADSDDTDTKRLLHWCLALLANSPDQRVVIPLGAAMGEIVSAKVPAGLRNRMVKTAFELMNAITAVEVIEDERDAFVRQLIGALESNDIQDVLDYYSAAPGVTAR